MTFNSIIESKLYWQDSMRTVYKKDCRDMSELADNSVQAVITSPPYWGLRKYSGEQDLIWGGKSDCGHHWVDQIKKGITGGKDNPYAETLKIKGVENYRETPDSVSASCFLCGAWKGQLGLEPIPDCGRHYLKLKDDLTLKQKEYVLNELRKLGAI